MVDEALEDEVWVTVVATGYAESKPTRTLREPAGEPRVTRTSREDRNPATHPQHRPARIDVEVPEFIPRY
jgi:cell division protein FtsZ